MITVPAGVQDKDIQASKASRWTQASDVDLEKRCEDLRQKGAFHTRRSWDVAIGTHQRVYDCFWLWRQTIVLNWIVVFASTLIWDLRAKHGKAPSAFMLDSSELFLCETSESPFQYVLETPETHIKYHKVTSSDAIQSAPA